MCQAGSAKLSVPLSSHYAVLSRTIAYRPGPAKRELKCRPVYFLYSADI